LWDSGGLSHQPDEPPFSEVDLVQGESVEAALSNGETGSVEGFSMLVLRGTHAERGKAHGYLGALGGRLGAG